MLVTQRKGIKEKNNRARIFKTPETTKLEDVLSHPTLQFLHLSSKSLSDTPEGSLRHSNCAYIRVFTFQFPKGP